MDNIFPMVKRIAARTIGQDLVSVVPIGGNGVILEEIKKEISQINRDRKIESLINDAEFKEMTISEHPEYEKVIKNCSPKPSLFYLDFKYG
jgi:hypothetical protein